MPGGERRMRKHRRRKRSRCKHQAGRRLVPGKGPHAAKVVCLACGGYVRWASREEAERAGVVGDGDLDIMLALENT